MQLQIQGKQIKKGNKLKSLGTITSTNRRQEQEIANIISKVIALYKTLYTIFWQKINK